MKEEYSKHNFSMIAIVAIVAIIAIIVMIVQFSPKTDYESTDSENLVGAAGAATIKNIERDYIGEPGEQFSNYPSWITFKLDAPSANEVLEIGSTYRIKWTATGTTINPKNPSETWTFNPISMNFIVLEEPTEVCVSGQCKTIIRRGNPTVGGMNGRKKEYDWTVGKFTVNQGFYEKRQITGKYIYRWMNPSSEISSEWKNAVYPEGFLKLDQNKQYRILLSAHLSSSAGDAPPRWLSLSKAPMNYVYLSDYFSVSGVDNIPRYTPGCTDTDPTNELDVAGEVTVTTYTEKGVYKDICMDNTRVSQISCASSKPQVADKGNIAPKVYTSSSLTRCNSNTKCITGKCVPLDIYQSIKQSLPPPVCIDEEPLNNIYCSGRVVITQEGNSDVIGYTKGGVPIISVANDGCNGLRYVMQRYCDGNEVKELLTECPTGTQCVAALTSKSWGIWGGGFCMNSQAYAKKTAGQDVDLPEENRNCPK